MLLENKNSYFKTKVYNDFKYVKQKYKYDNKKFHMGILNKCETK